MPFRRIHRHLLDRHYSRPGYHYDRELMHDEKRVPTLLVNTPKFGYRLPPARDDPVFLALDQFCLFHALVIERDSYQMIPGPV
jgi:hypothetical protein